MSSSLIEFSPPARYCGTAWVNASAVYSALAPFVVPKTWIEADVLAKKTDFLDDLVKIIKKPEFMFKKSRVCDSGITDIETVHIAVTSNTAAVGLPTTVYGVSSGLGAAEVATEWVLHGLPAVPSIGYNSSLSFVSGLKKWRVIVLRLATSIVHVFVSDDEALDCKDPEGPPNDLTCIIDGEDHCVDPDDDEDECEIIRSHCLKNFKLAC